MDWEGAEMDIVIDVVEKRRQKVEEDVDCEGAEVDFEGVLVSC